MKFIFKYETDVVNMVKINFVQQLTVFFYILENERLVLIASYTTVENCPHLKW